MREPRTSLMKAAVVILSVLTTSTANGWQTPAPADDLRSRAWNALSA